MPIPSRIPFVVVVEKIGENKNNEKHTVHAKCWANYDLFSVSKFRVIARTRQQYGGGKQRKAAGANVHCSSNTVLRKHPSSNKNVKKNQNRPKK